MGARTRCIFITRRSRKMECSIGYELSLSLSHSFFYATIKSVFFKTLTPVSTRARALAQALSRKATATISISSCKVPGYTCIPSYTPYAGKLFRCSGQTQSFPFARIKLQIRCYMKQFHRKKKEFPVLPRADNIVTILTHTWPE